MTFSPNIGMRFGVFSGLLDQFFLTGWICFLIPFVESFLDAVFVFAAVFYPMDSLFVFVLLIPSAHCNFEIVAIL
jgi:hypothetical protein